MNAYEIADGLSKMYIETDTHGIFNKRIQNMLRQQANRIADHEKTFNEMCELYEKQLDKQADRIAELEKSHIELEKGIVADLNQRQNAEPVAWMFEKDGAYMCFKHIDGVGFESGIPLYTTPQTELNAGGAPVKNATYWKRQYNKAQERIAELEKQLNTPKTYIFDGKQIFDTTPQTKDKE